MMSDLWATHRAERRRGVEPLAVRMRPRTMAEFVGQRHILGEGKLLRRMIDADRLTSLIFCGPPGTGKTTLAEVIANQTESRFERAHAASIGVKEIRRILDGAVAEIESTGRRTILFIDELHRFARNQQDVLLDHVERGLITLIGATTENPYFSINSALVSRSTVFRFDPLSDDDIKSVVRMALRDERGYGGCDVSVDDDALAHWASRSDGDARRALAALEIAVESVRANTQPTDNGQQGPSGGIHIDLAVAEESIQAKAPVYDGTGDEHYDVISAFIKSMRGSDPDAAVYWLARMLDAGEDPRFIARRIAILASEDIGNADPQAIGVAASAWEITERVGMPECQLTLAQAAIYMACAPKSNASAKAIWSAMSAAREGRTIEVPISLRDSHSTRPRSESSQENAEQSSGTERKYMYPHDAADGYVVQDYLGVDHFFYQPTDRGAERRIRERLDELRERTRQFRAARAQRGNSGNHD